MTQGGGGLFGDGLCAWTAPEHGQRPRGACALLTSASRHLYLLRSFQNERSNCGPPQPPSPSAPQGSSTLRACSSGEARDAALGPRLAAGQGRASGDPREQAILSEAVVLGIVFSIIKNTKRLPNRTKSSHSVPARPPAALLARPPHAAGTAARMPRSPSPRPPVQSWPLASLGPAASHLCPPGPWPGAQNCTAPRDPWEQRADGLAPRTWGRWLGGAPRVGGTCEPHLPEPPAGWLPACSPQTAEVWEVEGGRGPASARLPRGPLIRHHGSPTGERAPWVGGHRPASTPQTRLPTPSAPRKSQALNLDESGPRPRPPRCPTEGERKMETSPGLRIDPVRCLSSSVLTGQAAGAGTGGARSSGGAGSSGGACGPLPGSRSPRRWAL